MHYLVVALVKGPRTRYCELVKSLLCDLHDEAYVARVRKHLLLATDIVIVRGTARGVNGARSLART